MYSDSDKGGIDIPFAAGASTGVSTTGTGALATEITGAFLAGFSPFCGIYP